MIIFLYSIFHIFNSFSMFLHITLLYLPLFLWGRLHKIHHTRDNVYLYSHTPFSNSPLKAPNKHAVDFPCYPLPSTPISQPAISLACQFKDYSLLLPPNLKSSACCSTRRSISAFESPLRSRFNSRAICCLSFLVRFFGCFIVHAT